MDKILLQKAKSYVLRLVKYDGHRSLSILCKDSCSEISRLLTEWFRSKLPKAKIYIAKGRIRNLFHDLLLIEIDREIYIVDPTVWQFFKNKKSILMGKSDNVNQSLKTLSEIYAGKWKISEQTMNYSKAEIQKLKSIVAEQIK